ncbi:transposase [bacterium]|nr:transposase [bacterium]
MRFEPAARPPTDLEVGRLLAAVRRRIRRLARRRGLGLDDDHADAGAADRLALAEPALAALTAAAVVGRVATGPRAGHRVLRLGAGAAAPAVSSAGPRHAHREGFDLHADAAVRAGDRRRLERLCRYVLRPPVAQEALELTAAGQVVLRLRRPWRDGTQAIRFAPTELLERLAALERGGRAAHLPLLPFVCRPRLLAGRPATATPVPPAACACAGTGAADRPAGRRRARLPPLLILPCPPRRVRPRRGGTSVRATSPGPVPSRSFGLDVRPARPAVGACAWWRPSSTCA